MKLLVLALILSVGASSALAEIYTWKDAKGTVFYTNSLHEIPARYLKRARLLDVATGKAGPPVAASAAAAPDQANAAQPAPGLPAVAAPAASAAPAPEQRSYESRRSSRNTETRRAQRRRGQRE